MKKILLSFLAVAFCGAVAYAQEMAPTEKERPMKPMMNRKAMMGMMAMKGGMGGREIVATTDGGVVVLMGNKLMKYDRELNLKKEVELKVDREAMKKMMAGCPMMDKDKDMEEMEEKAESKAEEASEEAAPASQDAPTQP